MEPNVGFKVSILWKEGQSPFGLVIKKNRFWNDVFRNVTNIGFSNGGTNKYANEPFIRVVSDVHVREEFFRPDDVRCMECVPETEIGDWFWE